MKYIKNYHKMFESTDIVTDIKDILQELEDQGFIVEIKDSNDYNKIVVYIYKGLTVEDEEDPELTLHEVSDFRLLDIEEYILRLIEYMTKFNEYLILHCEYHTHGSGHKTIRKNDFKIPDDVSDGLIIGFVKSYGKLINDFKKANRLS